MLWHAVESITSSLKRNSTWQSTFMTSERQICRICHNLYMMIVTITDGEINTEQKHYWQVKVWKSIVNSSKTECFSNTTCRWGLAGQTWDFPSKVKFSPSLIWVTQPSVCSVCVRVCVCVYVCACVPTPAKFSQSACEGDQLCSSKMCGLKIGLIEE